MDLSNNRIEEPEVLNILEKMPNLKVLYLKGNPFVQNVRYFRKTVIARLKNLSHLDDRPVFDEERKWSEAWYEFFKVGIWAIFCPGLRVVWRLKRR